MRTLKLLTMYIGLIIFFCSTTLYTQKEFNIWIDCDKASVFRNILTWNTYNGEPMYDTLNAWSDAMRIGSAISDKDGNLLFYFGKYPKEDIKPLEQGTLLYRVLNGLHKEIDPFNRINPQYSLGDALIYFIVPMPDTINIYYLFYFTITYEYKPLLGTLPIKYAIIDMNQNNGFGAIVAKDKFVDSTKAFSYVVGARHSNGRDYWIIGREIFTSTFYAYLLTKDGISSTPVVSYFPHPYDSSLYYEKFPRDYKWPDRFVENFQKFLFQMQISKNSKRIVTMFRGFSFYHFRRRDNFDNTIDTPQKKITPYFDIVDFDNSTGKCYNYRFFHQFYYKNPNYSIMSFPNYEQPRFFKMGISPQGTKLYLAIVSDSLIETKLGIEFFNFNVNRLRTYKVLTEDIQPYYKIYYYQFDLDLDSVEMVNNAYLLKKMILSEYELIRIAYVTLMGTPFNVRLWFEITGSSAHSSGVKAPAFFYGFQTGPDNKLYFSSEKLGIGLCRINKPDKSGEECDVEEGVVNLFDSTSYLVFPIIVYDSLIKVRASAVVNNVCEGGTVELRAEVRASVPQYKVRWSGPGGVVSEEENPIITNIKREMRGYYRVEADLNGEIAIDSVWVEVYPAPGFSFTPFRRVTLCRGQSVEITAVPLDSNISFEWSTGDTTASIRVDKAGVYYVTATNEYGCQKTDSIEVIEAVGERLRGLSYDFGIKEIGTKGVHQYRFENTTGEPLLVSNAFVEDAEGVFTLRANPGLPARINPSEGIDFEVGFTPKDPKKYTGKIIVIIEEPCDEIDTTEVAGAGLLRMYVRLPEVTGLVGEMNYCIELLGKPKSATTKAIEIDYTTELHWDASDYLARGVNPGVIERNEISKGRQNLQLSGKFQLNETGETKITDICGEVLLSESKATPLVIETFNPNNELIEVEILNGELTTTGVCALNLRAVELLPERVLLVRPNPASEEIEIEIRGGRDEAYKIEFITSSGMVVYETKGILKERKQIVKLRTEAITSGLYQVRAMMGGEVRTAEVVVMK